MFCNSRTSRSVKEGLRDAVAIRWEIECKGGAGAGGGRAVSPVGAHPLGRSSLNLFRSLATANPKDHLLVDTIPG